MADASRVTICIIHEAGHFYTYADSPTEIVNLIEQGTPLDVWWVGSNGQRFTETMWFDPERLVAVRTERDDG